MTLAKFKSKLFSVFYANSPLLVRVLSRLLYRELIERFVAPYSNSFFPLRQNGGSYFKTSMRFGKDLQGRYFSQYYNEPHVNDLIINPLDTMQYKSETLQGRCLEKSSSQSVKFSSGGLLPLSIPNRVMNNVQNDKTWVEIKIGKTTQKLRNLVQNRFYYFPIADACTVQISSQYELIIGNPFYFRQKYRNRKKLVLCVFVDGLASEAFKLQPLKTLMPYSFKFFESGLIVPESNSCTDWTVPSVASIMSGLYPKNHRFVNAKSNHAGSDFKIISQIFQDNGYLTSQFCSNYGKTPAMGYAQGFDRTIYGRSLTVDNLMSSMFDHLKTFPDRDHFIWLSAFDLHHFQNIVPSIDVQASLPLIYHDYQYQKVKSVIGAYNRNRAERFCSELKRVDHQLNRLYEFVSKNYSDEDVTLCLFSDHGQPYFTNEKELFSKQRSIIPFFIKDTMFNHGVQECNLSNVDILPTLLTCTGVNSDGISLDGVSVLGHEKRLGRLFSFMESIYPGKPYQACIVDDTHRFHFKTVHCVDGNSLINTEEYEIYLENGFSGDIETDKFPEKTEKFLRYVLNHLHK